MMDNLDKKIKDKLESLPSPNYNLKQVNDTFNYVQSQQPKLLSSWKYFLPMIGVGIFLLGYKIGALKLSPENIYYDETTYISKISDNKSNKKNNNKTSYRDTNLFINTKEQSSNIINLKKFYAKDNLKQSKLNTIFIRNNNISESIFSNPELRLNLSLSQNDKFKFVNDSNTIITMKNKDNFSLDQTLQLNLNTKPNTDQLTTNQYNLTNINFLPYRNAYPIFSQQVPEIKHVKIILKNQFSIKSEILMNINSNFNHSFSTTEYSGPIWKGLYFNTGIGYATNLKSKFNNTTEYKKYFNSNFYEDFYISSTTSNISDIKINSSLLILPFRIGYRYYITHNLSVFSKFSAIASFKISNKAEYNLNEIKKINVINNEMRINPTVDAGISFQFNRYLTISTYGGINGMNIGYHKYDTKRMHPIIGFSLGYKF